MVISTRQTNPAHTVREAAVGMSGAKDPRRSAMREKPEFPEALFAKPVLSPSTTPRINSVERGQSAAGDLPIGKTHQDMGFSGATGSKLPVCAGCVSIGEHREFWSKQAQTALGCAISVF